MNTVRALQPGTVAALRLPREGPQEGGGCLRVTNREIFEANHLDDPGTPGRDIEAGLPLGLTTNARRPSVAGSKRTHTPNESKSTTNARSEAGHDGQRSGSQIGGSQAAGSSHGDDGGRAHASRQGPAERKRAEHASKWEKLDAQRDRDRKDIQERLERNRAEREKRTKRLVANMTSQDSLAARTAVALLEREAHDNWRKQELYKDWDAKVFKPIAAQCHEHMNPANRAQQQASSGTKSVNFTLPDANATRRLRAPVDGCPVRKPLVETARENAFHQAASQVLGHSQSAPDLRSNVTEGSVVPRARSRPTLEPEIWGHVKLQGTCCGHLAQISEQGANFKKGRRGGGGVHIPDESDGVPAVGKRTSRLNGHGDLGILQGNTASQGESARYKMSHGASCAAPSQDHYAFETGDRVTAMEFPLGKRMFPLSS